MTGTEVADALESLRAALDGLLEADFEALADDEFPGVLDRFEVQRRRLEAVDSRLLAATDQAHVAARHCRSSTADLLVHRLRLSPGEARARVRRARDLGPRRAVTGEPLSPIHARLAEAQRAGVVSAQQVDVATKTLGRLPAHLTVADAEVVEELLVTAARYENPVQLARTGTLLLDALDPDGRKPDEERAYALRELLLRRRDNGTWLIRGELTDEAGLALRTVLDPLAKPAPATTTTTDCGEGAGGSVGVPERDPRTAAQRDHDALLELCAQVLRAGVLPDAGGVPVTIVAHCDANDLDDPDAVVRTEHGHLLRFRALMRLAGDAEIVPVLFDRATSDCQLYLGRTQRLANRAQRRVLAARDGGCCFPGCDRPASWCEAHHVLEWIADLGPTDIDNLCLLCTFHHREFGRRGWHVDITAGQPRWTPPTWIDPDQKPITNTAHHLPDVHFGDDHDSKIDNRADPGGTADPPDPTNNHGDLAIGTADPPGPSAPSVGAGAGYRP